MNKLDELLYEITGDVDIVDRKMKKVVFPVDENNFADENFLRLYSCSKQYNVLKKVCKNIQSALKTSKIKSKREYMQQFSQLESCIPTYDYDSLEICPDAENLKLKYIKYLKQDKIKLNTQSI